MCRKVSVYINSLTDYFYPRNMLLVSTVTPIMQILPANCAYSV